MILVFYLPVFTFGLNALIYLSKEEVDYKQTPPGFTLNQAITNGHFMGLCDLHYLFLNINLHITEKKVHNLQMLQNMYGYNFLLAGSEQVNIDTIYSTHPRK